MVGLVQDTVHFPSPPPLFSLSCLYCPSSLSFSPLVARHIPSLYIYITSKTPPTHPPTHPSTYLPTHPLTLLHLNNHLYLHRHVQRQGIGPHSAPRVLPCVVRGWGGWVGGLRK